MKQEQEDKLIGLLKEALNILEGKDSNVPLKEGFIVCPNCNRQTMGDTCWYCSCAVKK